ncbi:YdcF family protein [Oscillospiraceae bacterium HV4-5-C5C]|nr:YdcF family protein [Oscillospiraceae bacterium HV4-5-C5C]
MSKPPAQSRSLLKHRRRQWPWLLPAVFLILTVFPPLSLGVVNLFTLLPALAGLVLLLWTLRRQRLPERGRRLSRRGRRAFHILMLFLSVAAVADLGLIIAGGRSSAWQKAGADTPVIVLGAQVMPDGQPSLLLRQRLETAADYLETHPRAVAVLSGGQGPDEPESEAACMARVLSTELGIAPERLIQESASTSTAENCRFSQRLLSQRGLGPEVVVLTNRFHLFRSSLIARAQGLTPLGLAAPTDWRLAFALYFREMLALPKSVLFDLR